MSKIRFANKPPKCFESKAQWLEYKAQARKVQKPGRQYSYCADCLPGFQNEMRNAARCDHPSVAFELVVGKDETELVGRRVK